MGIDELKEVVQILMENKLDYIKIGDIEIKKSLHLSPELFKDKAVLPEPTEEELLFWSSTPNPKAK